MGLDAGTITGQSDIHKCFLSQQLVDDRGHVAMIVVPSQAELIPHTQSHLSQVREAKRQLK